MKGHIILLSKKSDEWDAPPVVRCKDCIYWQDNNGGYPVDDCKWRKDETPDPEDYCSEGYRQQDKEGEA